MNGYTGKILWVDLTKRKLKEEPLDEKMAHDYIGGYGLGAKILWDRQKAGVDALGPENTLGFVTGPLSGTQALGASRYVVVGKSPLTGTWGDANSGGTFGPNMKFAGYDAVFFTGIASEPVYLFIDNGKAEIRKAAHLWGKDCTDTENMLKAELGADVEVSSIGPSGEKLALIAGIMNDGGRAAARSGLGAVMGSKKLKAVAVKGKMKFPLFDEAKIGAMRKEMIGKLGGPIVNFRTFGTPGILAPCTESGDTPVKNWGGAAVVDFPQFEKIAGNAVVDRQEKRYGCYHCAVGCGGHMKEGTGEYKYAAGTHKPEYETLGMFGTNLLNDNLESIIKANDICNRMGLDTISAGGSIAFTIECYENGLITQEDTDGLEMTWGNHKTIIAMLEKLAMREGFGNIIADGTQKAAERIGKGSEKYAMHIHGQEYSAHDPRKSYPFALCYRMDATPGRHTRDSAFPVADVPMPKVDPTSYKGRAPAQKVGMSFFHVIDCTGCCYFVILTYPSGNALVEFINASTGWNLTMQDVLKTGERIADIRHAFNIREGLNLMEYKTPDRMLGKPPLKAGPLTGVVIDEEMIVREFCEEMEWDLKDAKPSKKRLLELDMADVAKVLYP